MLYFAYEYGGKNNVKEISVIQSAMNIHVQTNFAPLLPGVLL